MSDARVRIETLLAHPLSDEQWMAVSAPLEPAAIVAGAGSGKTTVMAARVAWLVIEGYAPPDGVLGLTFTNKAAAELLSRSRRFLLAAQDHGWIDAEAVLEPAVSTYHSFAARLLIDHGVLAGLEPGAEVLAHGAREALAAQVVRSTALPLADRGRAMASVISATLRLDDALAELDLTPAEVLDDACALIHRLEALPKRQRIGDQMLEAARMRAALCGLVDEFRAAKRSRQVLDFADQVRWALAIVRQSSDVRTQLRGRYPCVLLDEYQDTSVAQRLLLQTAFGDGHPVTAVGDPCQAIYEWRGATVDNIDRFPVHFPRLVDGVPSPALRYSLADNRRSGPLILDLANHVAAPLRAIHAGVEPLTAAASGRGRGDVRCALLPTVVDETSWVADEVQRLHVAHGTWRGIAILSRRAETLVDIDRELRLRGVPTHLVGVAGLLDVPVVAEVRAILEVLDDPTANAACLRLLEGPRWKFGVRDLAALGRLASPDRESLDAGQGVDSRLRAAILGTDPADLASLPEAIDRAAAGAGADISPQARDRLVRLSAELSLLRRHRDDPPAELISRVLRITGLGVEMAIGPADEAAERARAMSAFRELAARFPVSVGGARSTLGAFLARLREAEKFDASPTVDDLPRGDAVVLMTIHKAKGLEFAHVIVPGSCDGVFPGTGRDRWPTNAQVVPWPLRDGSPAALTAFPDPVGGPTSTSHREFLRASGDLERAEERRLAYVAFTRAERTLAVSGHWWGPSQTTPRGPGEFLVEVHEWCLEGAGDVVIWAPPPVDGDINPLVADRAAAWPREPDPSVQAARQHAADLVSRARVDGLASLPLTPAEAATVADWDNATHRLLEEERIARRAREIELPFALSVSDVVRLHDDPDAFALDLARPMPRRPSAAARRGTALHSWIEGQYSVQTLFDLDDLDSADALATDAELERLRRAFLSTPYALRAPLAVEAPFAIVLGGRLVSGRIDAIFAGPQGRVEIVDWKSGGPGGLHDLQLAIYRVAWSEAVGTPLDRIDASFVLVGTGDVVTPARLPDRAELDRILSGP
ncbi:MAG: UvrD-helicase domain-containing protein [Actinomycetota bacterium]